MEQFYLTIDIGGTKTTGGIFTQNGELVENYTYVAKTCTYDGEGAVYGNVKSVIDKIIEKFHLSWEQIKGIGVGCPGPLDTKTGVILHAPLMKWVNFPLLERLKQDYNVPIKIDNDGNLGALAEQKCGVAKGLSRVIYMTVSTGCGGGFVLNGEIYHGKYDSSIEVGHMSIDHNGEQCPCGSRGCLELYASGTAINKRARERAIHDQTSCLLTMCENNCNKIDGTMIYKAAKQGDRLALKLYEEEAIYLGKGIGNLINLFDPDVIVLGGGVTKAKEFYHEKMMDVIRGHSVSPVENDRIRYSTMNDKVVIYGAYYLIKEAVDKLA